MLGISGVSEGMCSEKALPLCTRPWCVPCWPGTCLPRALTWVALQERRRKFLRLAETARELQQSCVEDVVKA